MPKTTFNVRTLTREARLAEKRGETKPIPEHPRPKVRADCRASQRPCPYVGCRHHMFLDITRAGGLTMPFGDNIDKLFEMPQTCSLDVAEEGPVTLEEISEMLNLTRERVRQIEVMAIAHLNGSGAMDEAADEDDEY